MRIPIPFTNIVLGGRSAGVGKLVATPPVLGAVITSPVAQPPHAQVLREFTELNRKMFRSYDAALTNNFNSDFAGTFGSADAEILTSLYTARSRARTLVKDSPHSKGIQRTFQNEVVGADPFRLQMRVGKWVDDKFVEDRETNRKIQAEWEIFGRPENFTVRRNMSRMEALRILEASAIRDGAILLRHYRGFPKNKYGYAVDLVESDRLQDSYMGKAPTTGNAIRFSIELDQWNGPVAYWLLTRHPGEVFQYNGRQQANTFRERVEADDIIHYNNLRDRAGQTVGFTELDCIVQQLHRDRQYDIALTYAAIASCCKPFWIKKEYPTGMQYTTEQLEQLAGAGFSSGPLGVTPGTGAGNDGVATQQRLGLRTNVLTPANTEVMDYGQSLMQLDPKFPIEAASEFKKDNLRAAGIGAGLAYQSVSGDHQNLGFAAALMCKTPEQENFKVRQNNFIEVVMRPLFREWLRYAILSGALDLSLSRVEEYVNAASFKPKRWAFVNPLVQAQTLILMLTNGLMSPQQVQDQLPDGVTIETLYAMIAEAKAEQEKHGLQFAADQITRPTPAAAEVEAEEPGADAPKKTKTTNPVRRPENGHHRNGKIGLETLLLLNGDGR